MPGLVDDEGDKQKAEEAIGVCGNGGEEEGGGAGVEGGVYGVILDDSELGRDPSGNEGDTGDGSAGGVDDVGEELAGDAEAIGEGASDSAEEDGVGEAVEKAEETESVDAEEELLFRIGSFFGEEAIEDGCEAAAFFDQGGEGSEGQGEEDGAEIPATLSNFGEEVVLEKTAEGEDRRGAGEEEGPGDGGAEEGDRCLPGDQDEGEGNKGRDEWNKIGHGVFLGELKNDSLGVGRSEAFITKKGDLERPPFRDYEDE
ncbi:MAG: hypothetical protein ACJAVK_001798 [Akkermansiaceae bacterium]